MAMASMTIVASASGNLWEKYNVVTGEVSTAKKYDTPAMMGWSAGVYLDCLSLMDSSDLYPQPQL